MAHGRRSPLHLGLAERLKQSRQEVGETTVSLSLGAGLARNAVWFIENEGRMPGLDVVERLAPILGVSPCHIAYGIAGPPAGADALCAEQVGERLRRARGQAGLSRSELGKESGTTGQSIANIEAGQQMPGVATAELLADALGVSPCWLSFGSGPTGVSNTSAITGGTSRPGLDTRARLIEPALYSRGWTEEHVKREKTLGAVAVLRGTPRRTRGRTDHVLRVRPSADSQPVAVALIEARKESQQPDHGMEQARSYAACARHNVLFVYSTNGHLFVEFDRTTGRTSQPRPLSEFPSPGDLRARYERVMGFSLGDALAQPLLVRYPGGETQGRYYQDAAMRAVLERIARDTLAGRAPRALLFLATGVGKTFIAVHLLRRLSEAGQLRRALFVCDRDESRIQVLKAFQEVFGINAQEAFEDEGGRNNAGDASVHIATSDMLGADRDVDTSFFQRHYPEGFFSHIIIDECHRPAWGKGSVVLSRNPHAVQVGMTAIPRRLSSDEDPEQAREDQSILADNLNSFGTPVYEYSLAQAMEDGYLAACQIELAQVNLDATGATAAEIIRRNPHDPRTGRPLTVSEINNSYLRNDFETRLLLPDLVKAMCADLFAHLIASDPENGPEQETIIFCAGDRHADDVVAALNHSYADWCAARDVERKAPYAFKSPSRLIATTVEVLTAGKDIPAVRNLVFFRYLRSLLCFHQMLARGTRIDEPTGKLLFTVYDYTAATRLFGQDFVTRARPPQEESGAGERLEGYGRRLVSPPPVRVEGLDVHISPLGRYVVTSVGGRALPVSMEDYRKEAAERLVQESPTLEIFRSRWVSPAERRELLDALGGAGYSPAVIRTLQEMDDYDLYDVLGDLGYGLSPRTRSDRAEAFRYKHEAWLRDMPMPAANTIRAITHLFIPDGTDGLESPRIWQSPEVRAAGGQRALRAVGPPAELLRETKVRMFAA